MGVEPFFSCSTCGLLPKSAFHASCLLKSQHRCRSCIKLKNAQYNREHREAIRLRRRTPRPLKGAELQRILVQYNRTCFVTGLKSDRLALIPAVEGGPADETNLVPVLGKLARCLAALPPDALQRWLGSERPPLRAAAAATAPPPPPPRPAMPVKRPAAARQPLVPRPPAMTAVEVDRAAADEDDMPVGLRDALSQYARSGERLRRLQRAKPINTFSSFS